MSTAMSNLGLALMYGGMMCSVLQGRPWHNPSDRVVNTAIARALILKDMEDFVCGASSVLGLVIDDFDEAYKRAAGMREGGQAMSTVTSWIDAAVELTKSTLAVRVRSRGSAGAPGAGDDDSPVECRNWGLKSETGSYGPCGECEYCDAVSLVDLLGLVIEEPPNEHDVLRWTPEECEAASDWAASVHIRASDNPACEVFECPAVLHPWVRKP